MKTPPFLLAAVLLFWGWQTGFWVEGAIMAAILESPRFIKARWDLSDDDFTRTWVFCTVLSVAALVLAFANNDGPATFSHLFRSPDIASERGVGSTSALTAIALIRWLPMIVFLFVATQEFSSRDGVPLESISLILWRRRKRALKAGRTLPPSRSFNVSYPYFVTCLFAASIHVATSNTFFAGLIALIAWALWPQRSRRFGLIIWAGALAVAVTIGYFGGHELRHLARVAEDYNPQWLLGSSSERTDPTESRTEIGHIGQLKLSGKIVIRLQTKHGSAVPTYLREASYRNYESQIWRSGNSNIDFTGVTEIPSDSGSWPLPPERTNPTTVNIACYLDGINPQDHNPEGLLPLPTDCGRLDKLPAFVLQRNTTGAVLAEGPGLVMFDAGYGSGLTMDSPPGKVDSSRTNQDLALPGREKAVLDQVAAGLNVEGESDDKKLLAVRDFFNSNFKYSLWQDGPTMRLTNETALGRFLLRTHSGHCEYFASATVLLLRDLHIPARYAVGYMVHEGAGGKYVVRLRDAHAWALVWNSKAGAWQNFDTTPASWVAEEEERASPLQFVSDWWSWIKFQYARFRAGHSQFRQYLLLALVPVLALLLYLIVFRSNWRKHRLPPDETGERRNWPGLDSEFYRLEQKLAARGLTRGPGESLSAWLQRVAKDPAVAGISEPLHGLLRLHYRHRFDPQGLSQIERETLRREVEMHLMNMEARARG